MMVAIGDIIITITTTMYWKMLFYSIVLITTVEDL